MSRCGLGQSRMRSPPCNNAMRDQSDREVVTSGHGSIREGVHNIGAALRYGQRRD